MADVANDYVSVDDSFRDTMNTNAIVTSDGQVLWMFPAVIKTYCTLDVTHFPFDEQKCDLVFISWTYNGHKLDVTFNVSEHQAVYYTPRVSHHLSLSNKRHLGPQSIAANHGRFRQLQEMLHIITLAVRSVKGGSVRFTGG